MVEQVVEDQAAFAVVDLQVAVQDVAQVFLAVLVEALAVRVGTIPLLLFPLILPVFASPLGRSPVLRSDTSSPPCAALDVARFTDERSQHRPAL